MPSSSGCSPIFIRTHVPWVVSSWLWCVIHALLLVSRVPSWKVGRNYFSFPGYFQRQYRISHLSVTIYLTEKNNAAGFHSFQPAADVPLYWCPEDAPDLQTWVAEACLLHVPLGCLVYFTLTVSISLGLQWNTEMYLNTMWNCSLSELNSEKSITIMMGSLVLLSCSLSISSSPWLCWWLLLYHA